MKSITKTALILALLITLSATTSFGKTRKASITLASDTTVNGAVVKKGNYEASYDDQSGELSIFKGTKLIVKTAARLEKRDQKARSTEVQTILEGMNHNLVSISFSGSYSNVLVGQAGM
jgi:hypothetical protein